MSIDFHTHVFHPKIAQKVLNQLEDHYGITPVGTGLVDDLLIFLRAADIEQAVVHTAATTPEQVIPANNWSIHLQQQHSELSAFGTIHPGYKDWQKEIDRLQQHGIKGLKFHPDFQGYDLADSRLDPIFEYAGSRFILLFHVGDSLSPQINPSSPQKLAIIRKKHPVPVIVAAHLGGYLHWLDALKYLAGSDVFLDTSSSLQFIQRDLLKKILSRHPLDRILFGSDYPLFDASKELRLLKSKAGMSRQQIDRILGNGCKLLASEGRACS